MLGAAPGLLRRGESPAHVIGAITYVAGSVRATLGMLSQDMGASVVAPTVALERILSEAAQPSAGRWLPLSGERPVAALGQNWRVLIPQEAYVFTGTLGANLTYYRAAPPAELDAAACLTVTRRARNARRG